MRYTVLSSILLSFFLFSSNQILSQKSQKVSGYITHLGEPLQGVQITVVDKDSQVVSDKNGRYEINVQERETLAYTYPGMETIEIIIEDVTKTLNVSMYLKINELEEVVVTERRLTRQEQLEIEWIQGEGVVKSAFGLLDKRSSALSIKFIEEDVINRSFELIDVIRKVAPGAFVQFDETGTPAGIVLSQRFCGGLSAGGCTAAGFDIDGFLSRGQMPFIPLNQIKRIAVIKSPVFGLYGRFGAGGLIIINVKNGQFIKHDEDGKRYDYARLRDNIYDGKAKPYNSLNKSEVKYYTLLAATTSKEDALAVYENQAKYYGGLPDFHFNVATYFRDALGDEQTYSSILENIEVQFSDNPNVLKALAYTYEIDNKNEVASKIYEQIFKLRPRYAQSYRDLSNSYRLIGEEKKSLGLIARYKKELFNKDKLYKSEIDSIISIETASLVSTGKLKLEQELKNATSKEVWPMRLLVEWNNSEAEFDIQLVNPDNHYYTWSHTLESNADFIKDEKSHGYSSKQFYIGPEPSGEWKFNVKYYGNKSFEDTYLKATVYYNYGSYSQTEKTFVFKLDAETKNINQNLLNLSAPIAVGKLTQNKP